MYSHGTGILPDWRKRWYCIIFYVWGRKIGSKRYGGNHLRTKYRSGSWFTSNNSWWESWIIRLQNRPEKLWHTGRWTAWRGKYCQPADHLHSYDEKGNTHVLESGKRGKCMGELVWSQALKIWHQSQNSGWCQFYFLACSMVRINYSLSSSIWYVHFN